MQQLILKEFFLQKKMIPFYFLIPVLSIFRNSVEPMGIAIGL
ncbi:TPA: ABC-2 transporter permease, partial [Bacillus toyonensis]|nr:ABC-2 transporter permease [Bacillus toyonensis]